MRVGYVLMGLLRADPLRGYLPTGWGWGRMLGRGSVGKTLGYASGENLSSKSSEPTYKLGVEPCPSAVPREDGTADNPQKLHVS